MFNPSQSEVRKFFIDAWQALQAGRSLEGAAKIAAELVTRHPEYHGLLESGEAAVDRQYRPEDGILNPFLHLSLHLAVEEQLAIDQPTGLRAIFMALLKVTGNEHDAQHEVMECLGEMLWQSQRQGAPPDGAAYLACVQGKLER